MAKAAASLLIAGLGSVTAITVVGSSHADPPTTGALVTIYRTVTETRTVNRRLDGKSIRWWAKRARANAHHMMRQRMTLQRIRSLLDERWNPTVGYAIRLASRVFNVNEAKMWQVARCESTLNTFAANGRYLGLFQLGWSPYGLSPYDPVANALSTAQTVARDGSWRQWSCG